MRIVHWSDKNPIIFFLEFFLVCLISGAIVLKCDLRYRDLRYHIGTSLYFGFLPFRHLISPRAAARRYHETQVWFRLKS